MERTAAECGHLQTADCRKHGVDIPDPAARGQNQHLLVVTREKTSVCLWRRRGENQQACIATGGTLKQGEASTGQTRGVNNETFIDTGGDSVVFTIALIARTLPSLFR